MQIEENKGKVTKFWESNKDRFQKKRQASKYLNHYGSVYKAEKGWDTPLHSKRGGVIIPQTPPSPNKNVSKGELKKRR